MFKTAMPRASLPALRQYRIWLFTPLPEPRTLGSIIRWWEKRRLFYNLFVGTVGMCSFIPFLIILSQPRMLESGEDAVEPMALFIAPFMINICYTLGAIIEAYALKRHKMHRLLTGPRLFMTGLVFSLIMILLPTVITGLVLVIRLVRH